MTTSLLSEIAVTEDSNLTSDVEELKKQYSSLFAESQNGMAMPGIGGIMNASISIPIAAVGVLASGALQSLASRYVPQLGKWAGIGVGIALILVGKRKKILKDFGVGVLLGGVAYAFEDFAGSLTDRFGERKSFEEDRMTWGGMDGGTTVMSPDRRVIQ